MSSTEPPYIRKNKVRRIGELGDALRECAPARDMDSEKRALKQLLRVVRHYTALNRMGSVFYGTCPTGGERLRIWPGLARPLSCACCNEEFSTARQFIQAVEGVSARQAAGMLGRRKWTPKAADVELGAREVTPRKKPLRRPKRKQICGARARSTGQPCRCRMLFRSGRCRYHGGLSTGPTTPEGKARVKLNLPFFRRMLEGVESPLSDHVNTTPEDRTNAARIS